MNNQHKCIYCKQLKQHNEFNKEHVLQNLFGKFYLKQKKEMVLINMVCTDCNQYFGDGIDLTLGRDSIYRFKRILYGYSKENKAQVSESYFQHPVQGAIIADIVIVNKQILLSIPEQIQVMNSTRGIMLPFRSKGKLLTNANFFDFKLYLDSLGLSTMPKHLSVLYNYLINRNISQTTIDILRKLGANVDRMLRQNKKSVNLKEDDKYDLSMISYNFDQTIKALGKAAFNYFAYHHRSLCLNAAFDKFRCWIRDDDASVKELIDDKIIEIKHSHLYYHGEPDKLIEGHSIGFTFSKQGDVMAYVSIFSMNIIIFKLGKITIKLSYKHGTHSFFNPATQYISQDYNVDGFRIIEY